MFVFVCVLTSNRIRGKIKMIDDDPNDVETKKIENLKRKNCENQIIIKVENG